MYQNVQIVNVNEEEQQTISKFSKELRLMMYAFGDAQQPLDESVQLMDQLVMDYITELVSDSLRTSGNKTRIRVDDVLFALRRDQKKLDRANELLLKFDELNKARKAFDTKPEDY